MTVVNNLARRGVAWAPTCSRPRVTACHSNWSGWPAELGGIGEVPNPALPNFLSHYRFFFNPIRYTSLEPR